MTFFTWRNISPSHTDFLITRTPVIKHIQQSRTAHEGEPIHQSLGCSSRCSRMHSGVDEDGDNLRSTRELTRCYV